MNFLAHFHLAWPDEGLVIGGLEGEYIRGPLRGGLPAGFERGVRLHRAIDAYTDSHPLIRGLRGELPRALRRYGGILIDLGFDHFLSLHWARFSSIPLADFNRQVYRILGRHQASLSDGARAMSARLAEHDVLNLFLHWDAVPAAAARLGQRFRRHNPFLGIDGELLAMRATMEPVFLDFYPLLQSFCEEKIRQL